MQNKDPILVFGASGMLGHKLMQVLSKTFSVTGTVRKDVKQLSNHQVLSKMNLLGNVDAANLHSVENAIDYLGPETIINCIGIVKQLPAAKDPLQSIGINSLFPHQLASLCAKKKIRLIHMSTDCIFSGHIGNYSESDPSDAEDLYGKTKFLGEVSYPGCLTIRTSIIGRELDTQHGLIEWFLSQQGKTVPGYKKSIFSGLSTLALSDIITQIIADYPELSGIYHIASTPISKFDLLNLVKEIYHLNITIEPDETVINNRSLIPKKFLSETDIKIPSWKNMITRMYQDPTAYSTIMR